MKEIYECNGIRVYSCERYASGVGIYTVGQMIEVQQKNYTVIHVVEKTVDWGETGEPIKGAWFSLLLTDNPDYDSAPSSAIKDSVSEPFFIADESDFQKLKKASTEKLFREMLEEKLKNNETIAVQVPFSDKESFKKCFGARASWDSSKRYWLLQHEPNDFIELNILVDVPRRDWQKKMSIGSSQKKSPFGAFLVSAHTSAGFSVNYNDDFCFSYLDPERLW